MAEIRPFRAWRYSSDFDDRISELTAPLFDVVSFKHRERLYKNPLNSIHLSMPREGYHDRRYTQRIEEWKQVGILKHDDKPSIYVYYQYFRLGGQEEVFCRKGIVAFVKLHDWEDGTIMRHENTIPKAVHGRKQVLAQTGLNVSPTHGLYTDEEFGIESMLDEAIQTPIYDSEDYQGVRDVLAAITDPERISKIVSTLADKKIILADGHHRYQGALMHRDEQRKLNPDNDKPQPYDYLMMYLTNTESADLKVFPTHRLIHGVEEFSEDWFLARLSEYFHIQELEDEEDVFHLVAGRKWAYGLLIGERTFNIRLKQQKIYEMDWALPDIVKNLDLSVLHYFVFERILAIPQAAQSGSEQISYESNINVCLRKVLKGEAQAAILTQGINVETIKAVCFSGHTLPQKSTFFYPKVICGYLFGSIRPEDYE